MAAPIVKWVGGKTRLLPELRARMPSSFDRYYEPFAGGAALFFAVEPERAVLADATAQLINLYQRVATDTDKVIECLEWLKNRHVSIGSRLLYHEVRDRLNNEPSSLSRSGMAAYFIYLNKTCFNGMWRVNKLGMMNTSWGQYESFTPDVEGIRAAAPVLARADLRCADYRTVAANANDRDFVYFDPPYVPLTETSNFTSYTADGFGAQQQCELAELATDLVKRGCKVMLSNSDTPFVRQLYRGFRVDTVQCARTVGGDGSKRKPVNEVIIVGGYDS